ncbi:MAG: anthranilate synthase component I family protein [Candidatus Caenarcaniphilales bacterium]|nr:anthranilate synthase component I family protein [Candidatus Caenarcaniphilales bacterium]
MKAYLKEGNRWSIFSKPSHLIKYIDGKIYTAIYPIIDWKRIDTYTKDNPIDSLRAWWRSHLKEINPSGFLVGFLSYDLGYLLERRLARPKPALINSPDFYFVIFDEREKCSDPGLIFEKAQLPAYTVDSLVSDSDYAKKIELLIEEIENGNVYEINLSRPWLLRLAENLDPLQLFAFLNRFNPAPYAGYFETDTGQTISSASPECLIQKNSNHISTFPIKGTRATVNEDHKLDQQQVVDLKASIKERAEHIMVVDLERNDLGRICQPGSIKVKELAKEYSFAHVHHLVSEVSGTLRSESDSFEVLKALFPGGSITGAPKLSAQSLIQRHEDWCRGLYTGSLGYITSDDDAHFNILIRTLLYQRNSREIYTQTGGGIVYDSEAIAEIEETKIKLRGLLW